MSTDDTPNPGSDEALARGCRCAVLDNAHGIGYMGVPGYFVITATCPLHGAGTKHWHSDDRDAEAPDEVGTSEAS